MSRLASSGTLLVSLQGMKNRMGGLAKKLGIPADGFGGGGM